MPSLFKNFVLSYNMSGNITLLVELLKTHLTFNNSSIFLMRCYVVS
jgi:hypothetical protein